MADWRVQSFQFAWFLNGIPEQPAHSLFEKLFKFEPSASGVNKIPGGNFGVLSNAQGDQEGVQYRINLQPGRLDLFVLNPELITPGQSPQLESHKELMDQIISNYDQISSDVGYASRIAIVLNSYIQFSALSDAAHFLLKTINFGGDIPDLGEVLFSLSKKKRLNGLDYNRALRWSSSIVKTVNVPLGVAGVPFVFNSALDDTFAAFFSVDVNTVPVQAGIAAGEHKNILAEAEAEVLSILKDGSPGVLND